MTRAIHLVSCVALLGALAGRPASARAGGLNDVSCQLTPAHPRPVVLVHGRGGNVDGFGSLIDALTAAGYCVFGMNYGQTDGRGPYGHDHLTVSGGQIAWFIRHVLAQTGAERVDVIGHSAGTGVLDNVILEKGDGYLIHRMVSFGGLHHPYAHIGAAGIADGTLFLPNLIDTARIVAPDITAQEVIVAAIDLYASVGGSLAGIDVETATSNFAADLFEPNYWRALHGGLSEPAGTYVLIGAGARSVATSDSVPEVCYTNIVGFADLLAGTTAGFQDEAPNVDNFLLLTPSDHAQILDDPVAVAKTLAALGTPCEPAWPDDDGAEPDGGDGGGGGGGDGDGDGDGGGGGDGGGDGGGGRGGEGFTAGGCVVVGAGTGGDWVWLLLGVVVVGCRRRR